MTSAMLYTLCEACDGKMRYPTADGSCPACSKSSTPGLWPVGVSMDQLERMVEMEMALAGDPGMDPMERLLKLQRLREKLDRAEARDRASERLTPRKGGTG